MIFTLLFVVQQQNKGLCWLLVNFCYRLLAAWEWNVRALRQTQNTSQEILSSFLSDDLLWMRIDRCVRDEELLFCQQEEQTCPRQALSVGSFLTTFLWTRLWNKSTWCNHVPCCELIIEEILSKRNMNSKPHNSYWRRKEHSTGKASDTQKWWINLVSQLQIERTMM